MTLVPVYPFDCQDSGSARAFHECARIAADLAHKALAPFSSQFGTGRTRGTDGTNPASSSGESATNCSWRWASWSQKDESDAFEAGSPAALAEKRKGRFIWRKSSHVAAGPREALDVMHPDWIADPRENGRNVRMLGLGHPADPGADRRGPLRGDALPAAIRQGHAHARADRDDFTARKQRPPRSTASHNLF